MADKFIRVFKKLDVQEIKKHLLVYGALSATCGKCKAINVKLNDVACPECKTEFKYVAFRNVKANLPKIQKLNAQRPSLLVVDFDDYNRSLDSLNAEEFLK